MMAESSRQWLLASRPAGMLKASDFELRTIPVVPPGDGQMLVRNHWLAFGPAMRGWMEDRPNYIPPVALGAWVADGSIAWRVDIQKGFENVPETLLRLYSGVNRGKQLLEL